MDGYALGVEWFNQEHGEEVEVLGWDPDSQTGLFAGTFQDPIVGQALASDLYDQGADTVFPVAGVTSVGALDEAIERKTAGDDVRVIGVDYDWSRVLGDPDRVILTSVIKDAGVAVFNQIAALVDGSWTGGEVVEDLASEGVDIARFRKLNRIVPGPIKRDLKNLRTSIINGTIPTMPVGGLANPVQLVFSPSVVDPPAWQLLEETLHEMTSLEFDVTAPADWREFVDMMCASPDTALGTSATAAYVVANEECGVDAGLRATRFGHDRYWSQFLVPRDGPLESIDELAELTWAYPDEGSMSGYVVPLGMMAVADIEVGASSAAGSHDAAALAVYNGDVDFATTYFLPPATPDGIEPWEEGEPPDIPDAYVDSCASAPDGLYCDGYRVNDARATAVGEAPDIIQQVRILGISPAIPNDGVSFGADFPSDARLAIEMALTEMANPVSPYNAAFEDSLGALYGWQGVVPDDDGDYDELRVLLDAIGFGLDDI
jgi:ABC-type phosphate/phosphonate transport system substrate-binding protein